MGKKIRIKSYEWVILILLIFFCIGYLGLFSLMSNYISKIMIYFAVLFVWIMVMKKHIVKGIRQFKKEYFNDALSIVIVIILVSSFFNVLFVVKTTYSKPSM